MQVNLIKEIISYILHEQDIITYSSYETESTLKLFLSLSKYTFTFVTLES